ncbi:LacI family DNA-binding transcriptional regulator [Cohnella thermotolerans]|jgi:LacI family transcriptional regulator|uniref:LacI family DNA-binding transcriptional regulator n=1 Tax=Cohnella thermotolerans TaxID=329858 RepID=UPI0004263DCE|nr:LacI family DNA-binding transcriptional regulator [Cohnella thermotolerans]
MASIKDIAAKANVSTATVSYVLNGTRNVSPKTRERVLKVIEEMQYKPNTIAQSLKTKKTDTIGVIAEDVTVFNTPEIIDGIHDCAERHDLHILLVNLRLHKRIGRSFHAVDRFRDVVLSAVDELVGKQVDGMIYVGVHSRDLSGLVPPKDKPIVYTYCYADNAVSVNYDDERAAYEATQYLAGLGHRRIGVISGLIDSIPSRLRFNGFYQAVMDCGLPFDPGLIKTGDWETASGERLTRELMALPEPPTAILAMNDVMAVGVLRAAQEIGVRVPQDLSVMGFDNREFSDYLTPRLTTMEIPLHELGVQSMMALNRIIRDNGAIEEQAKPLCKLIVRDSTGPAPG